jgi:hypothetical protein
VRYACYTFAAKNRGLGGRGWNGSLKVVAGMGTPVA